MKLQQRRLKHRQPDNHTFQYLQSNNQEEEDEETIQ